MTIRVYGEFESLKVEQSVAGESMPQLNAEDRTTFQIARSGRIEVTSGKTGIASWDIDAIPDQPPTIEAATEFVLSGGSRGYLPLRLSDDYGVRAAGVEMALDFDRIPRLHGLATDPESAEMSKIEIPLPFGGPSKEMEIEFAADFAEHIWAGLPVKLSAVVYDAIGQEARTRELSTVLPSRSYYNPVAAAIAELSRDLLWNRENGKRVTLVTRSITHRPDDIFEDIGAFLMVRTALHRLESGLSGGLEPSNRDKIAEMLWNVALRLEEGELHSARQRMEHAADKLSEGNSQRGAARRSRASCR